MLNVRVQNDTISIGEYFTVSFQRTLRIPDDGKTYPLPPGIGEFPICRVEDYINKVPASWKKHGGVFIPMYQREALWVSFDSGYTEYEIPSAVKIGIGRINAISGKPWDDKLHKDEQDYIVCPDQPWLDGINAGNGYIRQFVAMPLGMGYTVEGQVSGKEEFGGIQIMAFIPKPDQLKKLRARPRIDYCCCDKECSEMGLAAGGKMKQEIYPDEYGIDTWDEENYGRVYIHIVNSMMYREITGMEPPQTPISAKNYTEAGLPWFELYDEAKKDIAPGAFGSVKSIKEVDAQKGFAPQQDDSAINIGHQQIVKLGADKGTVITDGKW